MDDEAPGWDAIDAAFARLYPGVEPAHFATARGIGLGDALQGISAFPADGHWHLVTYGLTELFEKESPYPQQSGFGYELTFRVRRAGDEPPPRWALNVLEQIARTVVDGTDYAAGHRLQTGTIVLAFTRDPEFPEPIDSPNGRFTFLQLVGVTSAELEEMKQTSTQAVLDRLAAANSLLVTDVER